MILLLVGSSAGRMIIIHSYAHMVIQFLTETVPTVIKFLRAKSHFKDQDIDFSTYTDC